MLRERMVNGFKLGRAIKKILEVMEEEGLSIAEAEVTPEWLRRAIKENSEWNEKGIPFTVYKDSANEKEVP